MRRQLTIMAKYRNVDLYLSRLQESSVQDNVTLDNLIDLTIS
ncbi:hypothetical protein [Marinomonas communis]|nr:hypothetical protein [Marinomonas communis]